MNKRLNIRQKINNLSRDPNLVLLQEEGIVSEFGNLTALGRRVQADLIFQGKSGSLDDLVEAVNAVYNDSGEVSTED